MLASALYSVDWLLARGGLALSGKGGIASALSAAFAPSLPPHGPRCHQYFEGLVGAHGFHCGVRGVGGTLAQQHRHSTHMLSVAGQQFNATSTARFEARVVANLSANHIVHGPPVYAHLSRRKPPALGLHDLLLLHPCHLQRLPIGQQLRVIEAIQCYAMGSPVLYGT